MTAPTTPPTPTTGDTTQTSPSAGTTPTTDPGITFRRTTPLRAANAVLYQQFVDALNTGDHERIGQLIAPSFVDHHPGSEISGLASYQAAIREARESLRVQVEPEEILQVDEMVITRVRLTGKHVGTVMGVPPTGRTLQWSSIELWRVSNGKLVERWAQDDLLGLRGQLQGDNENIALVRRLVEVVNARDHDALDELFAPSFVNHDPSWDVHDADELKGLLRAAVEALDVTAGLDAVHPAEGGRVIAHFTFTGRHVGRLLGRMPSGREVEWTGVEVYRMAGGKIAERWSQADTTGLMRQLGVPLPR